MTLFRLITNSLAPLTLLGAIIAYLNPETFIWIKPWFQYLFAATMFALGVVLQPQDLRETLTRPKAIALGVLAQFTIMPALGFAAAMLSGLPPQLALGFIIVACAPGAMASNVIVYLAGGAVAFSIALTTVATFLSPILTPTLVKWMGSVYFEIPFWPMMQTILLTVLLPLLVGLGVRHLLQQQGKGALAAAEEVAPAVASLAIILICSYAVAANQGRLASVGATLVAVVVIVNALGYLLGWQAARLFGFDGRHQLTMAIEIGMQNAGLGVVLALKHFAPETALPGALFAVWCILTSAGAASYLRRSRHRDAILTP